MNYVIYVSYSYIFYFTNKLKLNLIEVYLVETCTEDSDKDEECGVHAIFPFFLPVP